MIDFHSHILPGMDDGSRDVKESMALLRMLAEQGIKTVVATPHFYADHESAEAFLARREVAMEVLMTAVKETEPFGAPTVLCGAEVRYYAGISHMNELRRLCIEGTKLLLVEMSMSTWSEYTVRELVELASNGKVRPMMAHLDRYMNLQKKSVIDRLYDSGMIMQFNADFFVEKWNKHKALSLFRKGRIHVLGSDCHDLSTRPPHIGEAYAAIAKKYGEQALRDFQSNALSLVIPR